MDAEQDLLDLGAALRADSSGRARDDALARLDAIRARAASAMARGLPPAEYRVAEALASAAEAGTRVVRSVWRSHHPDRS